MNTTQLGARLEAEKDALYEELSSIAMYDEKSNEWTALPDTTDNDNADMNIEADTVEDWNMRRATVSELSTRYRNITRALSKIAAGTYGVCEISGGMIEADRLEANPAARTCKAHLHDEGQLPL